MTEVQTPEQVIFATSFEHEFYTTVTTTNQDNRNLHQDRNTAAAIQEKLLLQGKKRNRSFESWVSLSQNQYFLAGVLDHHNKWGMCCFMKW